VSQLVVAAETPAEGDGRDPFTRYGVPFAKDCGRSLLEPRFQQAFSLPTWTLYKGGLSHCWPESSRCANVAVVSMRTGIVSPKLSIATWIAA
jgi:hypothetical protein